MISYMDLETIVWIDGFDGHVTLWAVGSTNKEFSALSYPGSFFFSLCGGDLEENFYCCHKIVSLFFLINFGQ